jgi:ATP-dependent DNA ligase
MITKAYQIEPASCRGGALNFEAVFQAGEDELKGLVAEEKFDGLRYLLQIRPNGAKINYLTSRRISKITGNFVEKQDKVPFIRDSLFLGLGNSIFDGEFVSEGISSDTQHSMAIGKGEYYCWDMLMFRGKDLRALSGKDRRRWLLHVKKYLPHWLHIVPQSKNPVGLLRVVAKRNGEGLILKEPDCEYGVGWLKVKREETHDCVILGYVMSTEGKYFKQGWIKSIRIGQYVKNWDRAEWKSSFSRNGDRWYFIDVGCVSGMDDRTREYITNNQTKLLGVPIEIEAQMRLPSGKFRHGRFLRFRRDKNQYDCLWKR